MVFIHNLVILPTKYLRLDKTGLLHKFASSTDEILELFKVIFNGIVTISDSTFKVSGVKFSTYLCCLVHGIFCIDTFKSYPHVDCS